jgi:hypothetical protein
MNETPESYSSSLPPSEEETNIAPSVAPIDFFAAVLGLAALLFVIFTGGRGR